MVEAPTKKVPPFQIVHPVRKERWLNMGLYGEFGCGKTYLAATAADCIEMKDVLFIDAESGDLTLQTRPGLDVIQINKYSQLARVYEWLRLHCKARDEKDVEKLRELDQAVHGEDREPPRYKTVVIDSLSEVFKYAMYQLTGTKLGSQALDLEPEQPGYSEWGKATELIRLLVRSMRDLPLHVIFVCSEKSAEDKNKKASIGLNLPRALASEVPGFLDVVAYLAVNSTGVDKNNPQIERRLILQPGGPWLAKNRFNFPAAWIEDPNMSKVIKLIKFAD